MNKNFQIELTEQMDFHIKELTIFHKLILDSKKFNEEERQILIKQFVVLAYSHWEGFVKSAFSIYIKEINRLKIKPKDLKANLFVGDLKLKYKTLTELPNQNFDFQQHLQKTIELNNHFTKQINLSDSSIKGGKSIIEFTAINKFLTIFCLDNLSQSAFQEQLGQLCKDRNLIAHGDFEILRNLDIGKVNEISRLVSDLMGEIINKIIDGYNKKTYLNSSH